MGPSFTRSHLPGQLASGTESWLLGLKAGRCASTPAGTLPAALSTNCPHGLLPVPSPASPTSDLLRPVSIPNKHVGPKSHVSIRVRSITVSAQ